MAQEYNEILPSGSTNILQDNIDSRKNDEALRSGFSGSAFPTSPVPVAGQRCYREDLKKEYIFNGENWIEVASSGAIAQEVTLARGTHTELQNRLSVSMNPDGTLKTPATANVDEFKVSGLEPTYVSTNSFSVPGDMRAIFTEGRRLKITQGAETIYPAVVSSSYDNEADKTTIVINNITITNEIAAVDYSMVQYGVPLASETVKGVVELATPAEVLAGTDTERAVTPAGFKAAFGEFYPVGVTPTYVDSTHFTVAGDQTAIFTRGRVLKITDTGGTFNAICSTSAYDSGTGLTTVTVAGDTIDSGISAVLYAVSQHTSAIWESGSNSNGEYIKFVDGTMVCYLNQTVTDQAINVAYGSFYQGSRSWVFPCEFSVAPIVISQAKWGAGASWTTVAPPTTTLCNMTFLDVTSRPTGTSMTIVSFAIGRWF